MALNFILPDAARQEIAGRLNEIAKQGTTLLGAEHIAVLCKILGGLQAMETVEVDEKVETKGDNVVDLKACDLPAA